jgi:hypothetical protein
MNASHFQEVAGDIPQQRKLEKKQVHKQNRGFLAIWQSQTASHGAR